LNKPQEICDKETAEL